MYIHSWIYDIFYRIRIVLDIFQSLVLIILLFPLLLSDLPPILLCPFFSIILDSTFIPIYPS